MLKDRSVWKYFFYLSTFFFAFELIALPPKSLLESVLIFLVALSLLALYGYSHQKRLGQQIYWKINFIVQMIALLIALISGFLDLLQRQITFLGTITFIIFILIAGFITTYWSYGQFAYAFRCDDIWRTNTTRKAQ